MNREVVDAGPYVNGMTGQPKQDTYSAKEKCGNCGEMNFVDIPQGVTKANSNKRCENCGCRLWGWGD